MHAQLKCDAEKMLAQQAGAAQHPSASCEFAYAQRLICGDLAGAARVSIKRYDAERLDVWQLRKLALEFIGGAQCGGAERVCHCKHQQCMFALGKQSLESMRGMCFRVVGNYQAVDRRIIRYLHCAVESGRGEQQESCRNPAA